MASGPRADAHPLSTARPRPWWWLVALLCLLLTAGVRELPRACQGDAHGHACTARTCACVVACTCQAAHEAERSQRYCTALPTCHTGDEGDFSLPADRVDALVPPAPRWRARLKPIRDLLVTAPVRRPSSRAPAVPEEPPRA